MRLCGERNITINNLAKISNPPPSSVKNIIYGKSKAPKITTIKKFCDGFDMTLYEFFAFEEFENLEK